MGAPNDTFKDIWGRILRYHIFAFVNCVFLSATFFISSFYSGLLYLVPEGAKDPRECQRPQRLTKTPEGDKDARVWQRPKRMTKTPRGWQRPQRVKWGSRGFGENICFCVREQIMTVVMVWCTDCFVYWCLYALMLGCNGRSSLCLLMCKVVTHTP